MTQDLLDELPPPQRLALAYAPSSSRMALLAVLALDARLAMIVRRRNEVVLAQMRIAWWRDMFARPQDQWPEGDLILAALANWRDPASVAALCDGWEALLDEVLDGQAIDAFTAGREASLVGAAREIGAGDSGDVALAARHWALADLSANLSDPAERAQIVTLAQSLPPAPPLPRALRPLRVLAGLGGRALRRGGGPLLAGPGDALCALRLGLIGR